MSKYAVISDPKSKGQRILIYDKEQDVFYTAPRSIFVLYNITNDRRAVTGLMLLFLISYPFGLLCDAFINKYLWSGYLYFAILLVTIFFSAKYIFSFLKSSQNVPSLIGQNKKYFTVTENLQTGEQRRTYLASIGNARLILISLPLFLVAMICVICYSIELIFHYSTFVLCITLFMAGGGTFMVSFLVNACRDESRQYLWKKFVRKK